MILFGRTAGGATRRKKEVSVSTRQLTVEEILVAKLDEHGKRVLKALFNEARVLAGLQAADHVVAANQALAERQVDFAGIERLNSGGQLEAEPRGVEQLAIRDSETNAFDALPFEVRLRGGKA